MIEAHVTSLAGHLIGVVIELRVVHRPQTVAGLAGRAHPVIARQVEPVAVLGHQVVAAARDLVTAGGMAFGAGEVQTLGVHVHVQLAVGEVDRGAAEELEIGLIWSYPVIILAKTGIYE